MDIENWKMELNSRLCSPETRSLFQMEPPLLFWFEYAGYGSCRAKNQDLFCHATLKLSVFDRVQFDAIRVMNHFQNHISLNFSVYEISTTTEGTNWKGVSAP